MSAATPIAYVENLSEIIGGGPLSLLTLLHNLEKAKYIPVAIFYSPGGLPTQLAEAGIEVHIIPRGRGWALPLSVFQLAGLFRRRGIRLVHVNSLDLRAGLAAKVARIPCVGHLRVIFPFTWIDRLFVRLSTCVISVSNAVQDSFCKRHPGLKDRFTTIPNSVSLTNMEPPADIREELDLAPTTPLVAAVSRIDPWKGLPTFVEAAAQIRTRLPETRFLLLGDADPADPDTVSHEQDLRRQVSELGLDDAFYFLGFRRDALAIIEQINVLTVCSRVIETPGGQKTEGFGRVIVEAMALNTPVVATRVGGIPEIIVHGTSGLLVSPDAPEETANATLRLLEDQRLAAHIIEGGHRRYTEEYHIKAHINRIQALYDHILKPNE